MLGGRGDDCKWLQKGRWKMKLIYKTLICIMAALAVTSFLDVESTHGGCPNGMVSYWTFDNADLSGNDPLDVYGPNDAMNFGAQTGIEGIVGEAIEFGTYEFDYLDISNDPSLEITGDISWVTWAYWNLIQKGPGEGHDIMFEKGMSDCVDLGYRFGTSAADFAGCNYPGKKPLYFVYDDCETVCDSSGWEPTAGQWYHIAIVARISEQEVDFYVDGTKISSEPCIDCVLHPNTEGIKVGKSNESGAFYHFPGLLDEMALFNRALDSIEVQQMYLDGLNGKGYCDVVPSFSSPTNGFESPIGNEPVIVKKNRVLPLKVALRNENNDVIGDDNITSPPVLQVIYNSGIPEEDPVDVTEDTLSAGWGTEGNVFEYEISSGLWRFNLKTKNYRAAGTYTISIVSGDESEYIIDNSITATFVINN